MTTLKEFNSYGVELERRLRLKTYPFAVKLLKSEADIPEGAIRPKKDLGYHLAQCQAFSMSRREGKTVAMFLGDMWCYSPVLAFGIVKPPEYYLEGNTYFPAQVSTREAAKNLAAHFPRLKYGECKGILSAPLNTATFEPDLIVIYCDSAQLRCLLVSLKYKEGERVTSTLEPGGACVQSTVPAITSGECQVAVPCGGDRRFGLAKDDEMIFTVPAGKLEDLMQGLKTLDEKDAMFPIKPGSRIEYPLNESYIRVGKEIGMEVHD
jgi:uncharacterized protein (DUF169 family)